VIITNPVSIRRLIVADSPIAAFVSHGVQRWSAIYKRIRRADTATPAAPLGGSASRAIRSDGRTFAPLAMGERDRDIARSGSGTNAAPQREGRNVHGNGARRHCRHGPMVAA
jgi:hypothetical protein